MIERLINPEGILCYVLLATSPKYIRTSNYVLYKYIQYIATVQWQYKNTIQYVHYIN